MRRIRYLLAVLVLLLRVEAQEREVAVVDQVSEGRNLAAAFMAAIARVYADTGHIAATRAEVNATTDPSDTRGKYVTSVDIIDGSVAAKFGGEADEAIVGRTLVVSPYQNPAGEFWWRCADAVVPEGFVPLGTYQDDPIPIIESSVPWEFMPESCGGP